MTQWRVTNTGIERQVGAELRSIRRPAGLTEFGWRKHADAVCAELNAGLATGVTTLEVTVGRLPLPQGENYEPWTGGENPGGRGRVDVVLRDGTALTHLADLLRWTPYSAPISSDILFWRRVEL